MLTSMPEDVWTQWRVLLLEGTGAALLTLAAVWIALGRNWRWARLLAFFVLLPSALMVVWLVIFRMARFGRTETARTAWVERISRMALILLSLLMVLPAFAVCWRVAHPLPIPVTTLPSPNGYDELVEAGRIMGNVNVPDSKAGRAELEAFVVQYGRAYALAGAAIRKPCQVPVTWNDAYLTHRLSEISGIRQLARAFCAKARLAKLEGRTADAVAAYMDTIRLGQSAEQGGLLVDLLMGNSIRGMGHGGIRDLRRELSARQCLELIRTHNELLNREEPLDGYVARDAIWADNAYGVQGRFLFLLYDVAGEIADDHRMLVRGCNRSLAKSRMLICDLAIQAYSLAHGRPPAKLGILVPDYLPEVPEDPFSGGTLVYRLTPDGYLLYSVGVDGVDDGGRRGDQSDLEPGCDIQLDDAPQAQVEPQSAEKADSTTGPDR